ncbi:MAG: tripartite tricarboxylate transporter TctB family protein [Microbacterium sp.]|uniref:Tripartite tricarboxylate transporter TctB family protein n=1 Tax=Microbacterium ginsengisoli TaxID=400772 RepID=A0A0F0LYY7_9MICO|nr:tripartite tricarboxylate transporter TctB family protein [Microbacterium ginsengisoli]KJL36606.1 Tripartite tricarboxylate transporter TctB family protein [Microbacterium ginsengisoli]MAL07646.1 tripartite tricarboxylate transporter TctB family protein [Microbacterium sp.]HAN25777.1 tripartite tricarboxylate transporter TctB family protein [Microbacterium ginsengisoli]
MTTDITPTSGAASPPRRWSGDRIGELVFAALVFGLGLYALIGAFAIRTPAGAQVGPRVFPYLVSALLIGAGTALIIGVLRGRLGQREEGEDIDSSARTDWWTITKLVLLFVGVVLLLDVLGWWLTAALLFGGAALSLGAKKWWIALTAGLILGIATQILFGEGLGLFLPRGWAFDAWYGPGPLF